MSTCLVEAKGLTKRYPAQREGNAIENINLIVPSGQMFGLIGPDGAGKSTTLRILSTVLTYTRGEVKIGGLDLRKEPEKIRKKIGYMPQTFSLYPDLSVEENLNFFANINHVSAKLKEERIEQMLTFTRLQRFTQRRAGALSGGMKKKLALACALIHAPDVLILDEPSTGVDPVSRRELWTMLAGVVQSGVTILVSTPYMDEAERCHKVGIIYQGKLLVIGAPLDLENDLPFDILEVKAKPRKVMREIVEDLDGVIDWRPVGDRLRLSARSRDVDKILRKFGRRLKNSGAEIRLLRRATKTMEDVFVHQVKSLGGHG